MAKKEEVKEDNIYKKLNNLKARAYDLIAMREKIAMDLQNTNQAIAQLSGKINADKNSDKKE